MTNEIALEGLFQCPNCSAALTFPDNPSSSTMIKCGKCGADIAPYGEFEALMSQVAETVGKGTGVIQKAVRDTQRKLDRKH